MAYSIPPLDFSRSPNSFYTVSEAISAPHDDSTVQTGSSEHDALSRSTTATSVITESPEDEVEEPMPEHKAVNLRQMFSSSIICDLHTGPVNDDRKPMLEHKIVDLRRMDSASTISSRRGKLVKRQASTYSRAGNAKDEKKGWQNFRCDVHPAVNSSYAKAEAECKEVILAAGGEIDTTIVHLGGFFYRIPGWKENPLKLGRTLLKKGHAEVDTWTPFPKPVFDRFKIKPYHAADRTVTAERRRTIAGPEHLLHDVLLLPKARPKAGRRVVSSWLGM